MAADSGQKGNHNTVGSIVGHLTAFSHIFNTKPRLAFVELMCEQQVHHIVTKHDIFKNLIVGNVYIATHLNRKQMSYKDGSIVQLLETTRKSNITHLWHARPEDVLKPSFGFCNYKGTVVESCAFLGIYRFEDNIQLCLALLSMFAHLPLPSVGQTVSVYNAHKFERKCSDKYDLVLCGRSSIILHGKGQTQSSSTSILDEINMKFTYKDLFWLKKQLTQFEEKFDNNFLIENGLLSEPISELQQKMLIKAVKMHCPVKEGETKGRYVSKEFLSSPHQCGISKSHTFVENYLPLKQLWEQAISSHKIQSLKPWNHYIIHYTDGLVGFLSASLSNGYWMLSDATHSISCVLTGDAKDLVSLHGVVVFVRKCTFVTEAFKNVKFVYVQFTAKDVQVIHPSNSRNSKEKLRSINNSDMTCHSETPLSGNKTVSVSDKIESRGNEFSVENIVGYNLVNMETVVPSKCTWLIMVHHKTTVASISQCRYPVCCLLISLIGTIHEVADGCYSTKRQYLMLTGKLLQFVPLLSNNFLYMLNLPDHVFPQPCRLKMKSSILPDVSGVCLPEESTFSSIDTQQPGFLGLKSDAYNVSDKTLHEEVGQRELVNVEGVICDRFHKDVMFESEKILQMRGYGIPGMKNIVLKLRDSTECGEEFSLYLNNWNYRAYPFGLIPGAKISAMFVAEHKSRNSSCIYFQTTAFTRIEVLHMPTVMEIKIDITSENWGPSCTLTKEVEHAAVGSTLWGCLNMFKILKLTVATTCSHCNGLFRNGSCVLSCNIQTSSAKLSASATCCMEDVFGQVLIFMKDEQVCQLLGISKPCSDILAKLIGQDDCEIELPQSQWNPLDPIGKRMLQALLMGVDKHPPRFHILCRKMKMNKGDAYEGWAKLYCLALRKPRPLLLYHSHKTRM